jgi:hypothetical protein
MGPFDISGLPDDHLVLVALDKSPEPHSAKLVAVESMMTIRVT